MIWSRHKVISMCQFFVLKSGRLRCTVKIDDEDWGDYIEMERIVLDRKETLLLMLNVLRVRLEKHGESGIRLWDALEREFVNGET